jgi:hypothetical protein
MAGAVQAGALIINMAADVASLKTDMASATRTVETSSQKMGTDLGAIRKGLESALDPLQGLTVKVGSLESQMNRAQSAATSMAKGLLLGAAAGMSIDAIKGKILGVIDGLANLKTMSEKTGTSVESLSKLGFFAKQSGSDLEAVTGALAKLSKGMTGADNDSKGAGLALKFLGLSAKDSAGNLKDPSAMLTEIAKKLAGYEDGAGKASIAQAMFGKSGADMLPMLKLMAEQGDVAAKATDAQATAARQYQKDLARLNAEQGMMFKTIAISVLPAMSDFAGAMLDATKNTNLTNKAVRGLADDDSITDWADKSAVGIARLIDVIMIIPSTLSAISGSFKTVGADLAVMGAKAVTLNPFMMASQLAQGRSPQAELEAAIAARDKTLADANKKWDDLWNKPANQMEQSMLGRIAGRNTSSEDSIDAASALMGGGSGKKQKLNFDTSGEDGGGAEKVAAAMAKELAAYQAIITPINEKIAANTLELSGYSQLSESQKLSIKLDAEIASGKSKLSAEHVATARAKLGELAATEQLLKAQAAEKDVLTWIIQSTLARNASKDALAAEYAMYGKSSDAREIAMIAIKSEADLEKYLADARAAGKPITDEMIGQLRIEKEMRDQVQQSTMAQTKALGYAAQLATENKRFAAESIFDERDRAAALLEIDAAMWRERIQMAGAGTEAQKLLQEQYTTWYANQLLKPQLDADRKMWASIDSTAHDTFVSIFNSGKSAFDRLRDTLKNGLLDLLYQMTLKRWIFSIGASVTGSGVYGMAQAAGGDAAGSAMGAVSMISAAKSAYSAISTGFTGMASSIGAGFASLGATIGSSGLGAFGAGFGMAGTVPVADTAGLYAAAGGTGSAGSVTAGAYAGTAASYAAGMAAGKLAGSAISGQYGIGDHGSAVVNVGTAIGAIWGPLGAAIGGAIGGLVNRAFGMGSKEVQSKGIEGNFSSSGFAGNTFANWHQDGGWFRSDKNGHETAALDTATQKQLVSGFDSIKSVSADFAKSLGLSADTITGYSKEISVALTDDAAKNQEAIAGLFAGMGEDMAASVLSGYAPAMRENETYSAALQRLSVSLSAVNGMLDTLNLSLLSASVAGGVMASSLVDLFGGLDAMKATSASYFQNYYSEQEKVDIATRQLAKTFSDLGYVMPAATEAGKAQLRAQIDAALAGGAAEQKSAVQLMGLSSALASLTASAASAKTATLDILKASASSAMSTLGASINAEKSGAKSAFDAQIAIIDAQKSAAQASVDTATAANQKIAALSSSLKSTLDSMRLSATAAADRITAQGQIDRALSVVKLTGVLPDSAALADALKTVSQPNEALFSSYADFARDYYVTAGKIEDLNKLTGDQLTKSETALSVAKAQLAKLDVSASLAQKQYDAQIAQLDATLNSAQAQLDAANGTSTAILSLTSAISSLGSSLAGLASANGTSAALVMAGSGAGAADTSSAVINGLYQSLLGRDGDAPGVAYWKDKLAGGESLDQIKKEFAYSAEYVQLHSVPGFASGGDFGGGLRLVGERGPELEVTGPSRIFNAAQTRSMLGGGTNDLTRELLEEMRAMRAEIIQLKGAAMRTAESSKQTADVLDGARNGIPLTTEAA